MSSSPSIPPGFSPAASSLFSSTVQQEREQICQDLADLLQRTAQIAQHTLGQMQQKAQGGASDVLEAVRLLSCLQEQCREALAAAQLYLPSQEQEAQAVHSFIEGIQQASCHEEIHRVMEELGAQQSSLASSVGQALHTLAATRLQFLRHVQVDARSPAGSSGGQELRAQVCDMQLQHRSATVAIRTLSKMPMLSGAVERVGLAGLAQTLDGEMAQAMRVCHRHLEQIEAQESSLVRDLSGHHAGLQRLRGDLEGYGQRLERAQAVQMGLQAVLLEQAGSALETLTRTGIEALEQVQRETLRTHCALERLALQPLEEACRTAAGLQGAYGSFRGALLGLSERESLVHTLENWLLQETLSGCPRLFGEALAEPRWRMWQTQLQTVSFAQQPEWMAWTFQALGLEHPEVPESLSRLEIVWEYYRTAREYLQELNPGYDPRGEILLQIKARIERERTRWQAWAQLGMALDQAADRAALLELGARAIPSVALQEAVQRDALLESQQARTVAQRMQRQILGDWRRAWTLHPKGTLWAYLEDQIDMQGTVKELQHWEEIYARTGGIKRTGWCNSYTDYLQIYRTRFRLASELQRDGLARLVSLQQWLEAHGQRLERILQERALDVTRLAAPVLEYQEYSSTAGGYCACHLLMPQAMEDLFLQIFGAQTIAALRRAEILGLGRLRFGPEFPLSIGSSTLYWSPRDEISSAYQLAQARLQDAFFYLAELNIDWIDVTGHRHAIAAFRWRDHGRQRTGPIHAPQVFRTQAEDCWWAHPAERLRIVQTGLEGVRPMVSNMDYCQLMTGNRQLMVEWPVEGKERTPFGWSREEQFAKFHEFSLAGVESLLGLSSSELAERVQNASPKEWQSEAYQAQVKLLTFLEQQCHRTPLNSTALSDLAPESAEAAAAFPDATPSSSASLHPPPAGLTRAVIEAVLQRQSPQSSRLRAVLERMAQEVESKSASQGSSEPESLEPPLGTSSPRCTDQTPRFAWQAQEEGFHRLLQELERLKTQQAT